MEKKCINCRADNDGFGSICCDNCKCYELFSPKEELVKDISGMEKERL
jgi:hypothetical protein